jgi:nucleoside-diphosphate-sugar epimerase
MNILITGASGLIGSALKERLLAEGHSLVCLSRSAQVKQKNVCWIKHDLAHDSWAKLPAINIDITFHLAGQTSTYRARQVPLSDAKVNVLGALNLFEYLRSQSSPSFVVSAGTATQVGLSETLPINENLRNNPVTFYDISKLTVESYLIQYVREGWLRGCSLRLANVFGRKIARQQSDRGILDKVFSQAKLGKIVPIYGDGTYLRDYIFIDDVISAIIAAAKNQDKTNGRFFYIGTGKGTSLSHAFSKVVALACKQECSADLIRYVQPPHDQDPIEVRNAIIDSTAFREATGWVPKHDFDSGIVVAYQSPPSSRP